MIKDFGAIATRYAQDVVDGKIVSNKYHRLACKRHLDDLEKSKSAEYPYVFNPELTDRQGKKYFPAQRICAFGEKMPHIKVTGPRVAS
jgi:phage terminase large subunit-like protein